MVTITLRRSPPVSIKYPNNRFYDCFLYDDIEPVGEATLMIYEDAPSKARLYNLCIYPQYRGKKLSKILLAKVLEEGYTLGIHSFDGYVSKDNRPAIALYSSFGFQFISKRKKKWYIFLNKGA